LYPSFCGTGAAVEKHGPYVYQLHEYGIAAVQMAEVGIQLLVGVLYTKNLYYLILL